MADADDVPPILLASILQRAVAKSIDLFLVIIVVLPFVFTTMKRVVENPDSVKVPLWVTALAAGVTLVYEWAFVAWRGQPVGAMVMRVRVVAFDGGAVGFAYAGIRALVPTAVQLIPYGLGLVLWLVVLLWAVIDADRQGLQDKAAGTLVIHA